MGDRSMAVVLIHSPHIQVFCNQTEGLISKPTTWLSFSALIDLFAMFDTSTAIPMATDSSGSLHNQSQSCMRFHVPRTSTYLIAQLFLFSVPCGYHDIREALLCCLVASLSSTA